MVVAPEIVLIERYQLWHLMNGHGGDDSRVMNMKSGNSMIEYKLAPGGKDLRRIGHEL